MNEPFRYKSISPVGRVGFCFMCRISVCVIALCAESAMALCVEPALAVWATHRGATATDLHLPFRCWIRSARPRGRWERGGGIAATRHRVWRRVRFRVRVQGSGFVRVGIQGLGLRATLKVRGGSSAAQGPQPRSRVTVALQRPKGHVAGEDVMSPARMQ